MKQLFFSLFLLFLAFRTFSKNGLISVFVEEYSFFKQNPKVKTYRIFAKLEKGHRIQAVYGIPGHEAFIKTNTSFFNSAKGGVTSSQIKATIPISEEITMDSFLALGNLSQEVLILPGNKQFLARDKNIKPATIILYGEQNAEETFGTRTEKNSFTLSNGSWACIGGFGFNDTINDVLLAQVTTDGELRFELNIQVGTPKGQIENYVARKPTGNEIQLANGSLIFISGIKKSPPQISLISPTPNQTFAANERVKIEAKSTTPKHEISKVEFYINDVLFKEIATPPYECEWIFAGGSARIRAVAYDQLNFENSSEIIYIYKK